jgi:hypothetical protein
MPIPNTYYLDGSSLSTSFAVYMDAELLTCAPDGFYADGFTVREQLFCQLQPQQGCPECGGVDCGMVMFGTEMYNGVFLFQINLTAGSVGALVLKFSPTGTPLGISATYDSVVYNKFSSPTYGLLTGTAGLSVYLGDTTQDCGITGTTYLLDDYNWDGSVFTPTGGTETVIPTAGQIALTATSPGDCVMVIPKASPTPLTLNIYIAAPCTVNTFMLDISCEQYLPSFSSTTMFSSKEDPTVCEKIQDQIYYSAPVNGTGGVLGLYDWVFSDPFGVNVLADGYYITNAAGVLFDYILVIDGVIIDIGLVCP